MYKVGNNYCDYAICGDRWVLRDNPKFLIWQTCCHIVFSYEGFGLNYDDDKLPHDGSYDYKIYETDENPALDLLKIAEKMQKDGIIPKSIKTKLSAINARCCL